MNEIGMGEVSKLLRKFMNILELPKKQPSLIYFLQKINAHFCQDSFTHFATKCIFFNQNI